MIEASMKKVYSHNNVALAWHVRNVLEQQGISVQMRNDKLYSVVGELPVTECAAEVWVKHPLNYRLAEQLIVELESGVGDESPDWKCPDCGELNEGVFALCWNCLNGTGPDHGEVS